MLNVNERLGYKFGLKYLIVIFINYNKIVNFTKL